MVRIKEFDEVLDRHTEETERYRNDVIFQAYLSTVVFGESRLNFHMDVHPREVPRIVDFCRSYGIDEITISGRMSFAQDVLWNFQQNSCTLKGMVQLDSTITAQREAAFLIEIRSQEQRNAVKCTTPNAQQQL